MNIEESNVAEGLLTYGNLLGHVHLVDNHRQAAGSGQMDYSEVAAALKSMGFAGHLSAESFQSLTRMRLRVAPWTPIKGGLPGARIDRMCERI